MGAINLFGKHFEVFLPFAQPEAEPEAEPEEILAAEKALEESIIFS